MGNFSVLSNHAHLIVRTRPDLVLGWSDEEVLRRWKWAWPAFVDGIWMREVSDQEIEELLQQADRIQRIRRNLSSLSWFMARTKEPIARLCNAEMGVDGHFWAQRFGCRELLDDAAVLACHLYVDLNQLKAAMADSLDASRHSAIFNRIMAAKAREVVASVAAFEATWEGSEHVLPPEMVEALFADCWLAPICEDGPLMTETAVAGRAACTPQGLILPAGTVLEPVVTADESDTGHEGTEAAAEPVGESSASAVECDTVTHVSLEASESVDAAPVGSCTDSPRPTVGTEADEPGERSPAGETADDESTSRDQADGIEVESETLASKAEPAIPFSERLPAESASEAERQLEAALKRRRPGSPLDRPRVSDNAILAIPLEQYFTIVEQFADELLRRQSGERRDGPLSSGCAEAVAILETHGVDGTSCMAVFDQLETRCRRALGAASRVSQRAQAAAQRWFQGIGLCREVFVERSVEVDGHT